MLQTLSMMLVKLGGSVITDKKKYRTLRRDALDRLAREIRLSGRQTMVVHGAGSFGHVIAAQHRIQHGFVDKGQIPGAAQVMEDVRELDLTVISALNRNGVPAVSLPPSAMVTMDRGEVVDIDLTVFRRYADLGLVPVTFGDVVLDRSKGFGICSGDLLMEALSKEFRPERIIFCADVDGVFTADPSHDPGATLIKTVDRAALDSLPRSESCVDVTGSIFGKIECMMRIASHGGDAMVINGLVPGRLEAALRGEKVIGSKVVGVSR
jgi:isopentenyl phosphate kinase